MRHIALAVLILAAACSLPLKQKAVLGLQVSETAAEAAHDFERALCFNMPATESGGHCTNAAATTTGLTDARHQAAADVFSKAFGIQEKAADALLAWRAGDPPPSSFVTYSQDLADLLALARQLTPNSQAQAQGFLDKIQMAVDEAAKVGAIIGVH